MPGNDRRERRALSVVAVLIVLAGAYVPIGICGGKLSPDELVSQLESSWTPGVGDKEKEYFTRAGEICADLPVQAHGAADQVALRLLDNVLAKTSASHEVGVADLIAQSRLARFLIAHPSERAEVRRRQAEVLARLLGQVRQEAIDGYVAKQVYLNIAPPAAPGVHIAGMNPAAVSDPASRHKYEAAIRANRENNRLNQRQAALETMKQEFAPQIVAWLEREASAENLTASFIDKLIVEARLTAVERGAVLRSAESGRVADR